MKTLWGANPPGDGAQFGRDDHEYATWDAAYVLGSLSASDRREFEAHMDVCPSCRSAVVELSGMPALHSQLDRDELAAIDEADRTGGAPPVPAELRPSLLARVGWRRRRSRVLTWAAGAAAAVVLAIGVFVGIQGHSSTPATTPPQASVSSLPMAQVGTKNLASTVSLPAEQWGTYISMKCVCLAPINAHHDTLAMVVVRRDGSRSQLATWVAEPGHTATPVGSIATPVNQIASVQVVLADTGHVLLQRSL